MKYILTLLLLVIGNSHTFAQRPPLSKTEGTSTVRCAKAMDIVVTEFNKGREKGDELNDVYFNCLYESDTITYVEFRGLEVRLGIIAFYVDISNKKIVKSVTAY